MRGIPDLMQGGFLIPPEGQGFRDIHRPGDIAAFRIGGQFDGVGKLDVCSLSFISTSLVCYPARCLRHP